MQLEGSYTISKYKDSKVFLSTPLSLNTEKDNSQISVLDLRDTLPEPVKIISSYQNTNILDNEKLKTPLKLVIDSFPCFSERENTIYHKAHIYDNEAYKKKGTEVLYSLSLEHNKTSAFSSKSLKVTPQKKHLTTFVINNHDNCSISVNANKHSEVTQSTCRELNLPFQCVAVPSYPLGLTLDLNKEEFITLKASAESKNEWPLEVAVISQNGKKETVNLPAGDFIKPSGFAKTLKCFSCGCSCYQNLKLTYINNYYYLVASGWAINDNVRGIYKLNKENKWEYIAPISATANPITFQRIGSCHILWQEREKTNSTKQKNTVLWTNLCGGVKN